MREYGVGGGGGLERTKEEFSVSEVVFHWGAETRYRNSHYAENAPLCTNYKFCLCAFHKICFVLIVLYSANYVVNFSSIMEACTFSKTMALKLLPSLWSKTQ